MKGSSSTQPGSRPRSATQRKRTSSSPTAPKHLREAWPKECDFQAYVLGRLRRMPGIRAFKTIRTNEAGVSDIILCVRGTFVALELKKNAKEKPTELQKLFIDSVHKAGGYGIVAHCWAQIAMLLADMGYGEYDHLLQELPAPSARVPREV